MAGLFIAARSGRLEPDTTVAFLHTGGCWRSTPIRRV
jgi:hypothetical protein